LDAALNLAEEEANARVALQNKLLVMEAELKRLGVQE
jgi:hypothetical protein